MLAVLVAWRSRRATLLRLMAPFVFLLLALVIQLALDANSRRCVSRLMLAGHATACPATDEQVLQIADAAPASRKGSCIR